MAVSYGGRLGRDRLSPVCAPALHGLKPGYGCLTCPLPSCHGCVKVMPTREEAAMLQCGAEIAVKEKPALAATSASNKKRYSMRIITQEGGASNEIR